MMRFEILAILALVYVYLRFPHLRRDPRIWLTILVALGFVLLRIVAALQ